MKKTMKQDLRCIWPAASLGWDLEMLAYIYRKCMSVVTSTYICTSSGLYNMLSNVLVDICGNLQDLCTVLHTSSFDFTYSLSVVFLQFAACW